ncbi:MAG TPA: DUF6285 domain-containing protein [Vitreimonas sp.]|jgi:hypothetical protein|nr:DUF6285 domain-containing protein [Vitreimonas sp.]
MQDDPSPLAVLDAAIGHLRENVLPKLDTRGQFEMRVTMSALSLVRRTLALTPESDAAEVLRLRELLGEGGDLASLNASLCARIRDGAVDLKTPGLFDHLYKTAVEKLAVDQPNYSAYKRAIAQES